MNESNGHSRIQALLKVSLPVAGDGQLHRDLWPDMLKRIESGESRRIRVTAVDWVIAGLAVSTVFIFPSVILSLLYHL